MYDKKVIDLITSFGISTHEINILSVPQALCYLKHYHTKINGKSSIYFHGFPKFEVSNLTEIAINSNLTVYKRVVYNKFFYKITFICSAKPTSSDVLEIAQNCNSRILSKSQFNLIFSISDLSILKDCGVMFDFSVPDIFRIPKPLNNFNTDTQIQSFSQKDTIYTINLHKMSCTCPDFRNRNRSYYLIGDIRRLCKHLLNEYQHSFGLSGLTQLQKFLIENGHALKSKTKELEIAKTNQKVLISYDSIDDWWKIFTTNREGSYQCYEYVPYEKDFIYGDKPYGIVTPLRTELNSIYKNLKHKSKQRFKSKKSKESSNSSGCAIVVLLIILISLSLTFVQ